MKKIHLIVTIGLTLFLTSVCAEKYEYLHLKVKAEFIGSLDWSRTEWTYPNSSTQIANNNTSGPVQYDTLLGWCYFTDTPWLLVLHEVD